MLRKPEEKDNSRTTSRLLEYEIFFLKMDEICGGRKKVLPSVRDVYTCIFYLTGILIRERIMQ